MPAAYAHHRFGDRCIEQMPDKLKQICQNHRELFDFGVHGPDILFYHHPLRSTEVNRFGSALHHWTGRDFFYVAALIYRANDGKAAMLSYLLGFLAHFTLDSHCHGYINAMPEQIGLSHNYIESQYEAFLMKRDGLDPLAVDRSLPLIPSRETADVIARFFPFSQEEVLSALKGQRRTLKVFYSPKETKKKILRWLIHLLHIPGDFGDLFLDAEEHPACRETNEEILRLQAKAVEDYPHMLKILVEYLYERGELDESFQYDFEGELL